VRRTGALGFAAGLALAGALRAGDRIDVRGYPYRDPRMRALRAEP
jgi:hypothetical protein